MAMDVMDVVVRVLRNGSWRGSSLRLEFLAQPDPPPWMPPVTTYKHTRSTDRQPNAGVGREAVPSSRPSRSEASSHRGDTVVLVPVLLILAALRFGSSIALPFIGDDYVFLDMTRHRGLFEVLAELNTHFGWYRPWSRDIHFWSLGQLAGQTSWVYRATNILLWCAALVGYHHVVRRLAGPRVALLATLGIASLAFWGATVLWISGSQDLWMLALSMGSLISFLARRGVMAVALFALALLSKETAAMLPALFVLYCALFESRSWRDIARRTWPYLATTLLWLLLHPTLIRRLVGPQPNVPELTERPALSVVLVRNVLTLFNLDTWPRPTELTTWMLVSAALACLLVVMTLRALWLRSGREPEQAEAAPRDRRVLLLAAGWMFLGWLPMSLPSVGWHAYYGCLGAMGAWLLIAHFPVRSWPIAAAGLAVVVLLGFAHSATMSWDWGSEWYQRRAGSILQSIHDDLRSKRASFPPHSRVFLSHIPNNIGLIAGSSAALRVWYDDLTLKAGFLSYYRPRTPAELAGEDYFFRMDTLLGMVEIETHDRPLAIALQSNPSWEQDHQDLALVFLGARDPARAAREFTRLALLPGRPDALVMAAVCHELNGDSISARLAMVEAADRTRQPLASIEAWARDLRTNLPPPSPPPPPGSGFE